MSLIEKCKDCGGVDRVQHPMEYPSDLTAECCENCGLVFRLFTERGEWILKSDLRKVIDDEIEKLKQEDECCFYRLNNIKQKIFGDEKNGR